nr:integrase, catalytic region, zinc finger, CCHC-type, peptidase aspartic, catalytic [Tanacetum cinerariifolium]
MGFVPDLSKTALGENKTREDKEIDKVIVLENKVKVLDNIVYKTGQSVQTMNMLNRNCKRVLPNLSSSRKLKERIFVSGIMFVRGMCRSGVIGNDLDMEFQISKGSPVTRTESQMETYKTISQDIRDQLNAEAKAVQIILTGIDNDIYSTVDACPNACEMWKAIKRLKKGCESVESYYSRFYKMMNELIRNQCNVTNHQVNVQFLLQLQPEWQRFMTLVMQSQELKTVSYHKLYDILKQHQHEVNEIRAERLARVANPLALVAQQQPLNAEQADWRDHTDDDELEDQELEAHYTYMAQLQEVSPDAADSGPIFDDEPLQKVSNNDHYNVFAIKSKHPEQSESVHDTYPIEQDAHNVIIDSLDMSYDREEIDQNDNDTDLANERDLLASLIKKLKCEINENKNRNKILKTSNKLLIEKLKGEIKDFKNKNKSLESSNNCFKEANNKLSETNNLLYTDFKKPEAELARRNSMEYASKMEIKCAQVRGDFSSYKMEAQKSFKKYTQTINDLNQTILEIKDKLSAHQETISILSQQKEALINLYKTCKDKELDKVIALENKVKVLDNIVYKTGQSVQTMNMLNNKCRMSFEKPEFLKKAQRANPRLYDIGCYNDNLALMLASESDELIRLEKESRSKLSDLFRPFDYDKLINIYDLFIPQREKSSEQRYFPERSRLSHTSVNNGKSKESFNKQATLLEKRMDESIPLDKKYSLRSQLKTQKTQFLNEIDQLSREYYYADHMNAILSVYTELDEDLKAQLQDKGIVISELKKLIEKMKGKAVDTKVYYVEGLNHNLFSVGQFCDADLEVALRKSTCDICDLKGNDLLTGSRSTDLYSITLQDTNCPNLICLMAKALSSQAWLWHRRLSHLNFATINLLSKNDIVVGLPKLKFVKDHLCSSCELGKAKRK